MKMFSSVTLHSFAPACLYNVNILYIYILYIILAVLVVFVLRNLFVE